MVLGGAERDVVLRMRDQRDGDPELAVAGVLDERDPGAAADQDEGLQLRRVDVSGVESPPGPSHGVGQSG